MIDDPAEVYAKLATFIQEKEVSDEVALPTAISAGSYLSNTKGHGRPEQSDIMFVKANSIGCWLRLMLGAVCCGVVALTRFGGQTPAKPETSLAEHRAAALAGDRESAGFLGGHFSASRDYKEAYLWYYMQFLYCVRAGDGQEAFHGIKRVHAQEALAVELGGVTKKEITEIERKAVTLVSKVPLGRSTGKDQLTD